jgi:hypothetical protein
LGFTWQDYRLFVEQQVERVFARYARKKRGGHGRTMKR